MINNDILRRLRYSFNFNDKAMVSIFAETGLAVTQEQVVAWLKHEDLDGFDLLEDEQLAHFLNGFINFKRGKREGAQPAAEKRLTNNAIFRKLRIALDLKDVDILAMMDLADFPLSKHELSAFFRKEGHKNYRTCQEQVLRQFLRGMQFHYRPEGGEAPADESENQAEVKDSDSDLSAPELRRQKKSALKPGQKIRAANKPTAPVASNKKPAAEDNSSKNTNIWNK